METSKVIRIGVLTSSRADYGIYLPLLRYMERSSDFNLSLIAFGTHLSKFHGYTIKVIEKEGFYIDKAISNILASDDPGSVATSYAITALKFSDYWSENTESFDYVLCLGDRYEMAAAIASGIPFGINFVHLHGGETTLGAIDNVYRHSITLASKIHFVSLEAYKDRIRELIGKDDSAYICGSISLDNLEDLQLLSINEFKERWNIDLSIPSILTTIHPETIGYEKNELYADQSYLALSKISNEKQIIITMPNADTSGMIFREMFLRLSDENENIHLIENFGTQSYFSCMKYVDFLLGNTSSGIIEAATFKKHVINVGDRQKGRYRSPNTFDCNFDANEILSLYSKVKFMGDYEGPNIYYAGGAVDKIIKILKKRFV